jgi:hypothetical protein
MPKIHVTMTESEGWKPLPKATYDFIIDSVEEGTSKQNKRQLRLKTHVIGHPQYEGKKSMVFLSMVPAAAFRVSEMLDATGVDVEEIELPKGQEQDEEGNDIKFHLSFDTDDLVGATFRSDVDVEEYNGKDQNRFNNVRPVEAAPRPAAAGQAQKQQSLPNTDGAAPAQAAADAGPIRRTRRVVNAST